MTRGEMAVPRTPAEVPTLRFGVPPFFWGLLPAVLVPFRLLVKHLTRCYTRNLSFNLAWNIDVGVDLGSLIVVPLLLIASAFAAGLFGSIRAGLDGIVVKRTFRRSRFISWRNVADARADQTGAIRLLVLRWSSAPGRRHVEKWFMVTNAEHLDEVVATYHSRLTSFRAAAQPSLPLADRTEANRSFYRDPSIATERLWELAADAREEKESRLRAADILRERINLTDRDARSFRARIDEIAEDSVDESFKKDLRARALGAQK